jgi:hypothetical protein
MMIHILFLLLCWKYVNLYWITILYESQNTALLTFANFMTHFSTFSATLDNYLTSNMLEIYYQMNFEHIFDIYKD